MDDSNSTSTYPSSASALIPSAKKGLTGPQLASVLQVKYDTGGKRCADAQPRTQNVAPSQPIPPVARRSVMYPAQIVSPPLAAPESSQEIGPSHPALSESSKTARLPQSLTERWVDRSKGGVVAHASPCWLLALGAVCSVERKEDRFNTHSALHGFVAADCWWGKV